MIKGEGLRRVEVLRKGQWVNARLAEVRKGEKFRMFRYGEPFIDEYGRSEWVASSDGYVNKSGIGEINAE